MLFVTKKANHATKNDWLSYTFYRQLNLRLKYSKEVHQGIKQRVIKINEELIR